jgi:flagellar biosynthesis protein FliQ
MSYHTIDMGFNKLFGATATILAFILIIKKGVKYSTIDILLLLALGVYLYNLGWDIILNQRTLERKGFVHDFFVNPYFNIIAFIYIIDNYKIPDGLIRIMQKLLIGVVGVACCVSVVQLVSDPFFFTPKEVVDYTRMMGALTNSFEIRRVSIFGYLGNLQETVSFLPIVAVITSYSIMYKKWYLLLLILFAFIVPFGNNYRYAQLAYFVALLPLIEIGKNKFRSILYIVGGVSLAGVLFVGGLYLSEFDLDTYIRERVLSDSASTRLLAIEIFNKFFYRNPWFGSGVHLTDEVVAAIAGRSSQIHVGYLAHLYSYGIVGSLIAFSFWIMIAKRFYKTAIRTRYWGSLAGILIYLWANVTQVYYEIFCYGLIISFLFDRYYYNKWIDENNKQTKENALKSSE